MAAVRTTLGVDMFSPGRSWRGRSVAIGVTCVLLASACSRGTSHKAQHTGGRQNLSAGTSGQTPTGDTSAPAGAGGASVAQGDAGSSAAGAGGTGKAGGTSNGASGRTEPGGGTATGGGNGTVPPVPYTPPIGVTKDKITISAIAGFTGQ